MLMTAASWAAILFLSNLYLDMSIPGCFSWYLVFLTPWKHFGHFPSFNFRLRICCQLCSVFIRCFAQFLMLCYIKCSSGVSCLLSHLLLFACNWGQITIQPSSAVCMDIWENRASIGQLPEWIMRLIVTEKCSKAHCRLSEDCRRHDVCCCEDMLLSLLTVQFPFFQ